MRRMTWSFLTIALLLGGAKAGSGALEDQVRHAYKGKVLTLRQFYDAERLRFGPDGRLIGQSSIGPWTIAGQLQVTNARLRGWVLHLDGKRLCLAFDADSKRLRNVSGIGANDPLTKKKAGEVGGRDKKLWREYTRRGKVVEIDLELASEPQQMTAIVSAIDTVFLSPTDDLANVVPDFWRDFVLQQEGKSPPTPSADSRPIYKVGKDVSAPRALEQPDPEFSESAREAGYTGTAILSLIVTPEGKVRDVKISMPAGFGLDETAVEAVSRWQFDPGRKGGIPVDVQIHVSVDWRLY
jgi:TonB family protein